MRRRRVLWPLLLACGGLGWAGAHAFAYGAAAPEHGDGHRYLHYLPTSLALCLGLALGIVLVAGFLGRDRPLSAVPSLWLFGLVPMLGFAAHVQGNAHDAAIQAGLLVQLLFALVALRLAGGVLRLARGVAHHTVGPHPAPAPAAQLLRLVAEEDGVGGRRSPGARRPRAPPLPAAV